MSVLLERRALRVPTETVDRTGNRVGREPPEIPELRVYRANVDRRDWLATRATSAIRDTQDSRAEPVSRDGPGSVDLLVIPGRRERLALRALRARTALAVRSESADREVILETLEMPARSVSGGRRVNAEVSEILEKVGKLELKDKLEQPVTLALLDRLDLSEHLDNPV